MHTPHASASAASPAAAAPRRTWVFAVAFLCAALPAAVAIAVFWAGPAAGVVAAAAFVLPLLYAVPRGRSPWLRHRDWLLAAQALLTFLPLAAFGEDWVFGVPGLLGGLLLVTVAAPVSWVLFGAALVVEGVLRFGVFGVPGPVDPGETILVFAVPVYAAVALFGLVRLASLVTELHAARTELARLAVTRERLRAADRLRAAVGDRLATVTARARAALAALPRDGGEARDRLAEAAGSARQALDQVRELVAEDRREPGRDAPAEQVAGGRPTLAPRLARLILVGVLLSLSALLVADTVGGHAGPWVTTASVAGIAALAVLQLYHSAAWREGARPRRWRWTLGAQVLLTLLGFLPVLHPAIHGLGGFVSGSAALLLPGGWGWTVFAGIQAAIAAHVVVLPDQDLADFAYTVMAGVTTGLLVYGLSRLAGLAVALDETRRELARSAVVRERLRVAQDTHDLLGLGLSAVALKSDLAGRLVGRDDAKARAEVHALLRVAAQARAEVRAVTAEGRRLSLPAELDAAREVLASAGVTVDVPDGARAAPLPEDVETVLATVLREAVTNVLRHAEATRCGIELTVDDGDARLRVTNDGATPRPDRPTALTPQRRTPGGRGLANLSARATALGGNLGSEAEDGRFTLTVTIPLAPPAQ